MSIGEPLRSGIVEVGQRPGLEFLRRRVIASDRALRISGDGLIDPFDPFRRVEPTVAKFGEPPRGFGDGNSAQVVSVVCGLDVWRDADREREGLQDCRGIVD